MDMAVSLSVEEQAVCAREVETLYPMLGRLALLVGMFIGDINDSTPLYKFLHTVASFEDEHFAKKDMYRYARGQIVWTDFGQAVFEEVREVYERNRSDVSQSNDRQG